MEGRLLIFDNWAQCSLACLWVFYWARLCTTYEIACVCRFLLEKQREVVE